MDIDLLSATGLDPQALERQTRRLLANAATPWLNELLAARMAERLQWIKAEVRQAWLWQGLWGGGAQALRARYPKAELCALEDAAAPLLQARKPWWRKADWLAMDAAPEGQAQLLWAPLGLVAAPAPRALLARWHALLAEQGFLMVSSFGPDSFIELRQLYAREGFGELAPHWVDLHDLGDQLVEAGFAEPVMDQERLRLTWSDAEALWQDLARLGGNLHAARFVGLRTPRWKARWRQAVDGSLRGADGRIGLTLEFVCGHAIKPEPRLPVQQGETRIGLDALRRQLQRRGA
ncbi:biotin synthase [Inhella sp.]|uniref:biotin synthase n=1 Tax=Inhella sp. TaxID=1921806 RepID=UPI0035B20BDC